MAGRKPLPTKLKLLRGNPGKRPLNPNEPQPDPEMPLKPTNMGEIASAKWDEMAPKLHRIGILTEIDGDALEAYCDAYEKMTLSRANMEMYGVTMGDKKHPAFQVWSDSLKLMKSFLTEFGMTPSSRSRLSASKKESGKEDLSRFFGATKQ